MSNLAYTRMLSVDDTDISQLISMYQAPEISQYLSIGESYFHYVTGTENVFYYKVLFDNNLIGSIHLEKQETLLYMSILIFPEFQRMGHGTSVLKDIQNDVFELNYERIEVSIDESNSASLRLFENAGFTFVSKDGELMNFIYQNFKRKA